MALGACGDDGKSKGGSGEGRTPPGSRPGTALCTPDETGRKGTTRTFTLVKVAERIKSSTGAV